MPIIVPIVEGDGEIEAVPVLLRRILEQREWWHWSVRKPMRAGGLGSLKKRFAQLLQYAATTEDCGGIMVLMDLDDGCPKAEAVALAAEARTLNLACPIAIVFAHREYEAWFLASLSTVAGQYDLPPTLQYSGNVEGRRDVKGWFSEQMPPGKAYKETFHQVRLTNLLDIDRARRNSRSFRRFYHAVEELVQMADSGGRGAVSPR